MAGTRFYGSVCGPRSEEGGLIIQPKCRPFWILSGFPFSDSRAALPNIDLVGLGKLRNIGSAIHSAMESSVRLRPAPGRIARVRTHAGGKGMERKLERPGRVGT